MKYACASNPSYASNMKCTAVDFLTHNKKQRQDYCNPSYGHRGLCYSFFQISLITFKKDETFALDFIHDLPSPSSRALSVCKRMINLFWGAFCIAKKSFKFQTLLTFMFYSERFTKCAIQ